MAKLEAIEADEAVQQPTGMVQELPTEMMQQPPVMMQQPPQMVPAANFVQPQEQLINPSGTSVNYSTGQMPPTANFGLPQQQPNAPNGTLVDYSTNHAMDNLAIGDPWTTGMFDCFQNPTNAIITAYLPCITFGQIAEVLDAGEMNRALGAYMYLAMMLALCSHWLMGSKYRAKLRRRYNLVEAPFPDMVSHIFCPCCALAQEFRELQNRGLDPALGWRQIDEQQIQNPPQTQAMTR